jgi:tripartite-type tricarboxylate transporter receptor subunit TctC
MRRRDALKFATAGVCAAALPRIALAQDKVVHIVLPYSAGGILDVLTRVVAPSMQKTLGRTILVENKPGASGLISIRAIQNAPSDGSISVMVQNIGFVGLPYMQKVANFNPLTDFTPVAMMGDGPGFVYVHSSVPAKNMAEFIAWAKTQPNGVESATSGPGGGSHTWTLLLAKRAGIKLLPVPYKGGAEMTTAIISGEAKIMISTATGALNDYVRAGKVRLIGVASDRPSALAPGVPIVADTVPGFILAGWFSFFGPAKMPASDVQAVSNAVRVALAEPGVKEKFANVFAEVRYEGPAELAATVRKTDEFYRKLVADLNIVPQ